MTEKTEALVLRTSPFSRTSHVVTWLTPDFGRIITMVKGVHRSKSLFLGQYDLYYTCELVFYARNRNGIHIAKECAPLTLRAPFRSDWRASVCASYLADILCLVSLQEHDQRELYELATFVFDSLCTANGEKQRLLFWFEIRLSHLLGISPQLTRCIFCNNPIQDAPTVDFAAAQGGVLCKNCSPGHEGVSLSVRQDVLAILRTWQESSSPRSAQITRCSGEQLTALESLLGGFLKYHLDRALESRYRAFQTLEFKGDQ